MKTKKNVPSKESLLSVLLKMISSIFTIILINILMILTRKKFHDINLFTFKSDNVEFAFYILIIILIFLFSLVVVISTLNAITSRVKPFVLFSDYIILIATSSIIMNYWLIDGNHNFWNGKIMSNLFDIVMIFSFLVFIYFVGGILIRCFRKDSEENGENEQYFNSDLPIETEEDDILNRKPFADKISHVIGNQQNDSVTIGIFGEWGAGKSSVINLIKGSSNENIMFVDFKPWYFGKTNHDIIYHFFDHFLNKLKTERGYNPHLAYVIKKYANKLSSISLGDGSIVDNFKKILDLSIPNNTATLKELKDDINKILRKFPKRIVVYIDDIDRLEGSEIRMIFKLVRLIADFPKVTYIIALDEAVVKKSLSSVYFDKGNDYEAAKKYIQKFIQVPIYLPKIDPKTLHELCWKYLKNILEHNRVSENFDERLISVLINLKFSPRNIVTYMNLIKFYLPILRDEVNSRDLMYLLVLKVSSPELYHLIYERKRILLDESYSEGIASFKEMENINDYKEILEILFPYSPKIFQEQLSRYSDTQRTKWTSEKRICSDKFFEQYYMYGTPKKFISQNELSELIAIFNNNPIKESKRKYLYYVDMYTIHEVNNKLEHRLREIESKVFLIKLLFDVFNERYNIEDDREYTNSIMSLAKLIAREIYSNMSYNITYKDFPNIIFVLGIYKYLGPLLNEASENQLKQAVIDGYRDNTAKVFSKSYKKFDAKLIWDNCILFLETDEIKSFVGNWLKDDKDDAILEEFLSFSFYHKSLLKDLDLLIMKFISISRYFNADYLKDIFKRKGPKGTQDIKFNLSDNAVESVQLFLLAKNILYKYIYNQLKEIYELNQGEYNTITLKSYINEGIRLISEYGSKKEKEEIIALEKLIQDYNKIIIELQQK
ncbi:MULTISPECIES: KAP family P-loop NTPase fold protein [Bacillaceae]|uniref:KAP family NTPase n=1 Tax=Evansella alkalicola TaxID=745819 RepID=A0ABS6JXP1_9BACI|nr:MULTISPECIES: P-loop NTPase fold protein [Bacillaceae]MBU9723160.1 KAP family NTPase [Bacillus alkalicola]